MKKEKYNRDECHFSFVVFTAFRVILNQTSLVAPRCAIVIVLDTHSHTEVGIAYPLGKPFYWI